MANYVFNIAKQLMMNGHINLANADFDGATITPVSDNTHNDLRSAGAEFRVMLIKSGSSLTTAGEDNGSGRVAIEVADLSQVATLNECTATGYTPFSDGTGSGTGGEPDGVLGSLTVAEVDADASSYSRWDAADTTFNNIASGQTIEGFLIVWSKATPTNAGGSAGIAPGNASSQIPLVWIDISSNPISTNGGDIEIVWAADGIMRLNA